ncbi:uncharacterized protein LOC130789570 [Actinidia eriantha]|uniref:uncharacterized protein LOC130789570 n=1 Tax=Actinidia eriantha TaxID=165200 RepID=UPI0025836134|nr:uncharacterized protein LOC130789570 [Actinidia eriantha]
MAYPSPRLLALLLISTASLAQGSLTILGHEVAQLNITGLLVCSVTGNRSPTGCDCPGIAGVTAFVSCNNLQTNVIQALTNPAGVVNFIITSGDGVLFDRGVCFAYVRLPIASCTAFPPQGILRSTVNIVGLVQSGINLIANGVLGSWALA